MSNGATMRMTRRRKRMPDLPLISRLSGMSPTRYQQLKLDGSGIEQLTLFDSPSTRASQPRYAPDWEPCRTLGGLLVFWPCNGYRPARREVCWQFLTDHH